MILISPLLNLVVENVKSKKRLFFGLFFLFSIYPTLGDIIQSRMTDLQDISSIARGGSLNGYTIVNFVLMYMIGACIREMEESIQKIRTLALIGMWCICVSLIFIWAVGTYSGTELLDSKICLSYANPLVIAEAILVFLIFSSIRIGTNRFINGLAKASFTAYLFHGGVIKFFVLENLYTYSWAVILIFVICSIIGIYAVSWIVYRLYDGIMKIVFSTIKRKVMLQEWHY